MNFKNKIQYFRSNYICNILKTIVLLQFSEKLFEKSKREVISKENYTFAKSFSAILFNGLRQDFGE